MNYLKDCTVFQVIIFSNFSRVFLPPSHPHLRAGPSLCVISARASSLSPSLDPLPSNLLTSYYLGITA